MFPDNGRDEEDFAITGEQQGSEEQVEFEGLSNHHP